MSVPARVHLIVRPLLVSGQLAVADDGILLMIDSEQDPREMVVAFWHEFVHLFGVTDEKQAEFFARALAETYPDMLRLLSPLINRRGAPSIADTSADVRCRWERRERHIVGNTVLTGVHVCPDCNSWTGNYPLYKNAVCPKKDRRVAKTDRRRHP